MNDMTIQPIRWPRLGMVAIGVQTPADDADGCVLTALDHFIVKPQTDPALATAFARVYGPRPKRLDIRLPGNDPEQALTTSLKWFRHGRLVCRGDGQVARRGRRGEEIPCRPDECRAHEAGDCREVTRFTFLLPRLPGLGVWALDTESYHSAKNLRAALSLLGSLGVSPGAPLDLVVEPRVGAHRRKVHVLDLRLDGCLGDVLTGDDAG
jgi:hypothetical protein